MLVDTLGLASFVEDGGKPRRQRRCLRVFDTESFRLGPDCDQPAADSVGIADEHDFGDALLLRAVCCGHDAWILSFCKDDTFRRLPRGLNDAIQRFHCA